MVDIMNSMKFDYVVVGNHEFDYGPAALQDRIAESNFKWIGSNILEPDESGVLKGLISTDIFQVDGFKIGVLGVCTSETQMLSYPGDTIFADILETSNKCIKELKKGGAEVIIAITHQHIEYDRQLAKKVPGINLIIGGHDHSPFSQFEEETFIHKSGQNADYLGRIDLHIKRKPSGQVKVHPSWTMIYNNGTKKHAEVEQKIRSYMTELDKLKEIPYAITETPLESRTHASRARECSMGDFITDVIRDRFKCDVVIIQGGSIRGDSLYEAGYMLTAYDLIREFPFANSTTLFEIEGKYLKNALEEGVRYLPSKAGCFPQISGITINLESKAKPNERIKSVLVNGEPLKMDKTYTLVTTEFIRKGGDGYNSLTKGRVISHPLNGTLIHTMIVEHLKEKKKIQPFVDGRINIL